MDDNLPVDHQDIDDLPEPREGDDSDTAYDELQDMTSEDEYKIQEQRNKDIARLKSMTTELLNLVHRNEDTLLFAESKNAIHVLLLFTSHLEDEN